MPDLVSAEQVAEVNAEAVRFARGEFPTINAPAVPKDLSDAEAMARLLAVHFPHWVSPVVRSMIDTPADRRGAPADHGLLDLPGWDGSVKCMQSMLFVKPPGFQGQAWHQDEVYIPTRDRSLIGAWIALDDATIETAACGSIPGSHRSGYLYPQSRTTSARSSTSRPRASASTSPRRHVEV